MTRNFFILVFGLITSHFKEKISKKRRIKRYVIRAINTFNVISLLGNTLDANINTLYTYVLVSGLNYLFC